LASLAAAAQAANVSGTRIDASRIETQSWGEERPLVDGHDESAWSQNRRDEFEVVSGGDNLRRP
jgi:outer membrane protein OmpA-like peptidoglycan-associated protein